MKKAIVGFFLVFFTAAGAASAASHKFYNPENGHNYQVIETATTWEKAAAHCNEIGGYLVTITNEREYAFVLGQVLDNVKKDIWAGGTDKNAESRWEWVTGESWHFSDWRKGEPNNESNEDYLELRRSFGFQWNDVPNAVKLNWFICEWDPPEMTSEKITRPETGHSYRLIQVRKTWTEACSYCQEMDGYLATVTSPQEYEFLFNQFLNNIEYDIWAGGTDTSLEGSWEWITGEPWQYTNWHDGEPNNYEGNEDFLELRLQYGYQWNDVPDDARRNWFICEWGENFAETMEKHSGQAEEKASAPERKTGDMAASTNVEPVETPREIPGEVYTYFLPVFLYTQEFVTGISLSNNDETNDANVNLTVMDRKGSKIFASALTIVPDGQVSEVLYPESGGKGWVIITSDRPLTGVCFIVAVGSGVDNFMAAVPLSSGKYTNLRASHVICDKSWDTVLFVANPTREPQQLLIEIIQPDGVILKSVNMTLPSLGGAEYSLSEIVDGMDLMGGKAKLSAPEGVVAFSLYSNVEAGARSFSGVSCMQPFSSTDGDGELLLGQ